MHVISKYKENALGRSDSKMATTAIKVIDVSLWAKNIMIIIILVDKPFLPLNMEVNVVSLGGGKFFLLPSEPHIISYNFLYL
jgi:hypothetical protein